LAKLAIDLVVEGDHRWHKRRIYKMCSVVDSLYSFRLSQ